VLDVFRRELADIPNLEQDSGLSPELVEALMAIHFADADEAIVAVGDAFASWQQRSLSDPAFCSRCKRDSQAALQLMLGILGCSKCPRAVNYLSQALRSEPSSDLQAAILVQLRKHEESDEFRNAIMAGVERGDALYFSHAPHLPEIGTLVATQVLAPELDANAFSAAVAYLAHDEGKPAKDVLRQVYQKKIHADDPKLWLGVLCGLARHGDRQHLQEVFDLLVEVVEEPQPSSADKRLEYERKRRIDGIARSMSDHRCFSSTAVAEFLHTKDADKRPAVQDAIKTLLEACPGIARTYETLPALPDGVVRLAHGHDGAKGKTTYAGRGFGMQFARPDQEDTVIAIEFHAGRYNAPAKEFHIYLLGENQEVLKDLAYPIERVEWGSPRWYHFDVPPTEVPKQFMVGLDFNAQQVTEGTTRGSIRLSADTTVSESHSSIGTPESGYRPLEKKGEWIIRVVMAPRARTKQSAIDAATE